MDVNLNLIAMRKNQVLQLMQHWSLDALLIENPVDVFYLTGMSASAAQVVFLAEESFLLVDGRYYEVAKQTVAQGYEIVLSNQEALSKTLGQVKTVGIDSAFLTVDRFERLQQSIPDKKWVSISRPLKSLRVCKEPSEIAKLKRAAETTRQGYLHILDQLQEGISEQELSLSFELYCKRHGASSLSFDPIIAFGENSAYPHHRAGASKLKKNQIVLLDLGAIVDRYRGDMTRVVFFGEPDPKLLQLYELVQSAYLAAFVAVRPGCRLGDLDRVARSVLAKEGVESLFTHGLGHGIGLETHEYPSVRETGDDRDLLLRPGMVFTIEPGLYLPGLGGVRYENTIAVTENGAENFYAGL